MVRATCAVVLMAVSGCRCAAPEFPADSAAEICLTLQACSPAEFSQRFGGSLEYCTTASSAFIPQPGSLERRPAIMTGLDEPLRTVYQCVLAARGDCTQAASCWALSVDAGSCTAGAGLGSGQCSAAGVLSGCTADGQTFGVDCSLYGAVCSEAVFFGSFSTCAVAKCARRPKPGCRGDHVELCLGEAMFLQDCARQGQRCVLHADGGAGCVGEVTCAPGFEGRCEGSVAVFCQFEGTLSRTDCAVNPTKRRCEKGACVPTGTECQDLRVACEGKTITWCQDGFFKQVDCVAAGFTGCDAGACVPR